MIFLRTSACKSLFKTTFSYTNTFNLGLHTKAVEQGPLYNDLYTGEFIQGTLYKYLYAPPGTYHFGTHVSGLCTRDYIQGPLYKDMKARKEGSLYKGLYIQRPLYRFVNTKILPYTRAWI